MLMIWLHAHSCSVACYKTHKAESCAGAGPSQPSYPTPVPEPTAPISTDLLEVTDTKAISSSEHQAAEPNSLASSTSDEHRDPHASDETSPLSPSLKPLTSLNWPPEPDSSVFTDPLTKDDPKPLRREELLRIATSSDLRVLLFTTALPHILKILDTLPPNARHATLSRLLEVDPQSLSKPGSSATSFISGRQSPPPLGELLGAFASSGKNAREVQGEAGAEDGWWLRSGTAAAGAGAVERIWIGPEERRLMRLFAGSVCVAIDSSSVTEGDAVAWGNGGLEWEL